MKRCVGTFVGRSVWSFVLALGLVVGGISGLADNALAQEVSVEQLLNMADDLTRGDSSKATVTMHVKTDRWDRKLSMQMWTKGSKKTLIRILSPAKEKGTSTLRVDKDVWNYLPKVDRTVKVPASMMSGSWMGSHFSNDDLVKQSRLVDHYDCKFTSLPTQNSDGFFVVECMAKIDAPVVWGKVVLKATTDLLPVQINYHDEKGALIRTMSFSDVAQLDDRKIPRRMRMTMPDKPGEYTEILFEKAKYNLKISDSTFSLQALRR